MSDGSEPSLRDQEAARQTEYWSMAVVKGMTGESIKDRVAVVNVISP
jgi:hypothetical protein